MAKRKKQKGDNYLSNEQMLPEILRCKKLNRVTPEMAKMFLILTERYSNHPWWANYSSSWKEELKQEALLALVKGCMKFNPDYETKSGKPLNFFAYCTTICYRSFKSTRDKLKKATLIEDKCPPGLF